MKNIKQIRESYDFVTDKSVRDQRNLDALVEAGLFEERKLPVLKKILESSADRMSGSEKRFVVSLLESLIIQFANQDLIEAKGDYLSKYDPRGPKGQPSDSELPPVIILKRKAIRVYPDHQKVALYYAQTIDRYVSIPYGGNHVMTVNEETDDDKKRPVQKKKKQVPLEKREDLTMADLPAVRRYLMKSAFTSQDPLRAAMINLGTYSGIKSRLKKVSRMKKPERIEPQFRDMPKKSAPKALPATASSPVAKAAEGVWKQRRLEESFKDRLEVLREQAALKYSEPSYTGAERFMQKPEIADPSNQNRLFQNKNVFKKKPSIRKELKNLQQKVDRTKRVSPVDAKQKPGKSDGAREKFRKAAQERIARKAAEVKPDKVTGKSVVPSILKTVGPEIGKALRFGIGRNPLIGAISDATPLNAGEAEWLKDKEQTKRIKAREPGSSQDLAKQIKRRDAAAAATMLKDRGIKKTTTSFLNAPDKPVPQISTALEPVVSSAPNALTRQLSVQQQAQAQQSSQAQALASQPAQAPARQSNKDRKEEEGKNKLSKDDKSKRRSSGPKDRKLRRTRPGRFNMPDISLPSMPPGAKEPGPSYKFGINPVISTPTPVSNRASVDRWMDIINRKANQAMLRESQAKDDEDETGSATRTADDKPIYNFRRRPKVGISKATGTDAAVQAWLNRINRQANQAMLRQQDQQESVLHTIQSMVENNIAESIIIIGEQPITINNTVAKKIVSIHESMNKKNKKKMEEMLNESASSFNKVLTFAVRH